MTRRHSRTHGRKASFGRWYPVVAIVWFWSKTHYTEGLALVSDQDCKFKLSFVNSCWMLPWESPLQRIESISGVGCCPAVYSSNDYISRVAAATCGTPFHTFWLWYCFFLHMAKLCTCAWKQILQISRVLNITVEILGKMNPIWHSILSLWQYHAPKVDEIQLKMNMSPEKGAF